MLKANPAKKSISKYKTKLSAIFLFIIITIPLTASNCGSNPPLITHLLSIINKGTGTGTITSQPTGINCGTDCKKEYKENTEVALTATPNNNSTFTKWTGDCTGTQKTCTITMNKEKNVTAVFTKKETTKHLLTVTKTGSGQGKVTSNPQGINCGTSCEASYLEGVEITLTATASPATTSVSYVFTGWSGGCTGKKTSCTFTMDAAKNVTANFADTTKVNIPDKNLAKLIRETLGLANNVSITRAHMASLDVLSSHHDVGPGPGIITNLEGLQYAINLTKLSSVANRFSDLSPLANLTNLRELKIMYSAIATSGISALSKLTNLEKLELSANGFNDISPLAKLTKLQELGLANNQIKDILALSGLTNLQVLSLSSNKLSDISDLKDLTNLRELYLSNNQITDIKVLVENGLLGKDGKLDVRNNCLDIKVGSGNLANIMELIRRGVKVKYEAQNDCFVDDTPPTVESVSPKNQSLGVGRNPLITIKFSEAMNKKSVQQAFGELNLSMIFTITPETFNWSEDATTVTILAKTLDCGPANGYKRYGYKISKAAKDLAGNQLSRELEVIFGSCKSKDIKLYGEAMLDGYIYQNGKAYSDQGLINIGDTTSNTYTKGFLSFDLSSLTAKTIGIARAHVYAVQKRVVGTPFKDLDSGDVNLGIYHVNFGTSLLDSDFTTPLLICEQIGFSDKAEPGLRFANVTSWVQDDFENRLKRENKAQFMLTFDLGTDGRNDYDYVEYYSAEQTNVSLKPYLSLQIWVP